MLSRLFLLLVVVPFAELFLIFKVHGLVEERIGSFDAILFTFGSIIITGMVGAWFAKKEGLSVFTRLQEKSARGEQPTNEMVEGLMILFGGMMLLTPGYLTDTAGLSLVLPFTRVFFRKKLLEAISQAMKAGTVHFYSSYSQPKDYSETTFTSIHTRTSSNTNRDPNVIDITDYTDHSKD